MTTGITRLFLTKIKHNSEEQMTRTEKGMKFSGCPKNLRDRKFNSHFFLIVELVLIAS
jgi:hypothetical protein